MAQLSILKTLRRSFLLWFGVIFSAIGLMAAFGGAQEWRAQQHFQQEAVAARATVLSKSIEKATRDGNPRTKYLVRYRFVPADGQTIEKAGEVSVEEWERLDEGSLFPIRYLPSDPQTTQTDTVDQWWVPLIFVAGGLLFTSIGLAVAWSDLRHVLLVMRLSRGGHPAEGIVRKVWPTSTSINRVQQWRLSYEYRDHVGRTQEGESHLLSPDEASQWREGDTGAVRFDRERPEDSVWIGQA
ncbi:MAG TPA: DUF3592 domain-containing protein [Nitrospira sp.]|nr:DUF3592 domain-containing protein [Nitrospira sp.]